MNEEEIIEILEDRGMFIDTLYENYRQSAAKPFDKAIQGLLDLYQKEKEKNKELIEGQVETIEKIIQPELFKKYISKDKIKEKIEFYKRYGKIKNSNEHVMSVEIEVLEELLEERN